MESISTINNVIPSIDKKYSLEKASMPIDVEPQENPTNTLLSSKYLQPDQVNISETSRKKLSESEEEDQKTSTDISDKVMTKEEVIATSKANDIDKEIRELSMEILDITIQIEMLKGKENKESIKERQALEVELAIKKGVLDATIGRKLQMATQS